MLRDYCERIKMDLWYESVFNKHLVWAAISFVEQTEA